MDERSGALVAFAEADGDALAAARRHAEGRLTCELLHAPGTLPARIHGTVVTVGTFDGVHRGHSTSCRASSRARATGAPSLLVTFEPHPLESLNPAAAPLLLTSRDEKLAVLAATGLDYVAVAAVHARARDQSAEQFVDQVLRARFRMRELLIGHDHGFGRGRAGDVECSRPRRRARLRRGRGAPVETGDGQPVSRRASGAPSPPAT